MIALMQKMRAANLLARLDHLESRRHLTHEQNHKRDTYIARLVAIGKPAVPLLVRRLARVDETRPYDAVVSILEQIGDPAVPGLAGAMHDPNAHRRHNAIALLGRIATPSALRELEDESVDLVDREFLEAARHQARHHAGPVRS